MADRLLDYSGLKCPYPLLKLTAEYPNFKKDEIIEVIGDCPTFEKDIIAWCNKLGKTLLSLERQGNKIKALIRI